MSNQFIETEVKKIMTDQNKVFPLNMAFACAWIVGNLKGVNLKILDMSAESSLSDYYLLASTTNPTQTKSMAETIMRQMRNHNYTPRSTEGFGNCEWVLLDFGDIMIHLFLEHSREIYDLDTLWQNAPKIEIPQDYYYSSSDSPQKQDDESGYF